MKVNGKHFRTIWLSSDQKTVQVIDQTQLPHKFVIVNLETVNDVINAINSMKVRGAPLIGVSAAYGVALAMQQDSSDRNLFNALQGICDTRPTAINLGWALNKMKAALMGEKPERRESIAYQLAGELCDEDIKICSAIGDNGVTIIEKIWRAKESGDKLNILTHCNAGWLATVDWGTALSPIYKAHDRGIPVHVWVDETRPRNQGAALTFWELSQHGVPATLIVDNAGGYLMQTGSVDLCLMGTDRTTRHGDVCNKIGTYSKALAAHDNDIPFYIALPGPTIDWESNDMHATIPIEKRDPKEILFIKGLDCDGNINQVNITMENANAFNPAFDVTPARLITGLITERGICDPRLERLTDLYSH